MRSAVMGSGIAHLVALVAVFLVRGAAPLIVAGPDVVQVSLVDPGLSPNVPLPPPVREPEKKLPEVQPTEETGVKLSPPKPEKPKPAEHRAEPVSATPQPALPYENVGSTGLRGAMAVDASNFEFTYYLLLVRNRIAGSWTPPAGLVTAGQPVRAVVHFRITRGGGVSGVRLESGSGVEFFDRSTMRAVQISDPLPPLPLGYSGSELGVHFGFEYGGP